MRVQMGDKAPKEMCVWKRMYDGTIVIRTNYQDDKGNNLYAVYVSEKPHPWPRDLESEWVATGEHLTLDQVVARDKELEGKPLS